MFVSSPVCMFGELFGKCHQYSTTNILPPIFCHQCSATEHGIELLENAKTAVGFEANDTRAFPILYLSSGKLFHVIPPAAQGILLRCLLVIFHTG